MLGFSRVFHVSSTLGTEVLSSFVMGGKGGGGGTQNFFTTAFSATGPCCMHAFPKSPVTPDGRLVFYCIFTKSMARRIVNSNAAQWQQMNECSLAAGGEKREMCPYKLLHSAQLHVNCRESIIYVNSENCLISRLSFFGYAIRIRMHRNASQYKHVVPDKKSQAGKPQYCLDFAAINASGTQARHIYSILMIRLTKRKVFAFSKIDVRMQKRFDCI